MGQAGDRLGTSQTDLQPEYHGRQGAADGGDRPSHSGDRLPLSSCRLLLDDSAVHNAMGLRLGVNICEPH